MIIGTGPGNGTETTTNAITVGTWRSGLLLPADYPKGDGESSCAQAECLLRVPGPFGLRVTLRLSQLRRRRVHRWVPATEDFRPVGSLDVDGVPVASADETFEREVTYSVGDEALAGLGPRFTVRVPGGVTREELVDAAGALAGRVVRERHPLEASLGLSGFGVPGAGSALRLRVWVENRTETGAADQDRERALPGSILVAHLSVAVEGGTIVSPADPPAWAVDAVESCADVNMTPA
jgi:hypothetical protein